MAGMLLNVDLQYFPRGLCERLGPQWGATERWQSLSRGLVERLQAPGALPLWSHFGHRDQSALPECFYPEATGPGQRSLIRAFLGHSFFLTLGIYQSHGKKPVP